MPQPSSWGSAEAPAGTVRGDSRCPRGSSCYQDLPVFHSSKPPHQEHVKGVWEQSWGRWGGGSGAILLSSHSPPSQLPPSFGLHLFIALHVSGTSSIPVPVL